jgi:hypothetical protein
VVTTAGIELALSAHVAIDAKLRGCDLVKLRVSDVAPGGPPPRHRSRRRALVLEQVEL